ncbi:hypothetical protein [Sphingobium baderi]|uniref:Lipoprotein n=1 Tax=Sphingobium baderi TaxID=1332080 RepID=A0A0S3F440_9SPHN|nr:hypothetical protein [Sphingobium baderi]ALR22491.1 hypothetical protein ATN00_08990 [Sphingobium baderi]
MRYSIFACCALIPLAAACTPNDPTMGGAIRTNYAQQVINPAPLYEGQEMEGGDGARAAAAVERYRTDKVKQPRTIRTTSGSGGGGGGGSSGGSSSGGF